MDPRLFWDSTFYELGLFLDGARAARRDEYNNAIVTAWHAASLIWRPRLPKLEKFLAEEPRQTAAARPGTAQEQVEWLKVFFGKSTNTVN